MEKNINKALLIILVIVTLALRLYGVQWDQNHHLHPDERFLTMVGNAFKTPSTFIEYLNPQVSTFNPYNVGYDFYVYGALPVTINTLITNFLNINEYHTFTIFGRVLSALADTAAALMLFITVLYWQKKVSFQNNLAWWALFFYAITVASIQHSHFFVVDTFLTLFLYISFYFSQRVFFEKKLTYALTSAVFFGLAVSCKISALFMAPLIFYFIARGLIQKKTIAKSFFSVIAITFIVYLTVRVGDPKLFATGNFFDLTINPKFIQSIAALDSQYKPGTWFPPAVFWISKVVPIYALQNIAIVGVGIPYFMLVLIGVYALFRHADKMQKAVLLPLFVWLVGYYLYQGSRFIATMRYFIFIYPILALFGAYGLIYAASFIKRKKYALFATSVLMILVMIWPVSFMSIYTKKHSRVVASEWIYANIPEGSFLAQEAWDDALPLAVSANAKTYQIEQIPITGEDTVEKWEKIDSILAMADYYIITSNRGYGSMMPLPKMFPKTAAFYNDLFAGRTGFKKIAEFDSDPALKMGSFTIEFDDQWADEAYVVFDHPRVTVFKKIR